MSAQWSCREGAQVFRPHRGPTENPLVHGTARSPTCADSDPSRSFIGRVGTTVSLRNPWDDAPIATKEIGLPSDPEARCEPPPGPTHRNNQDSSRMSIWTYGIAHRRVDFRQLSPVGQVMLREGPSKTPVIWIVTIRARGMRSTPCQFDIANH
jgi:hypothetical protein